MLERLHVRTNRNVFAPKPHQVYTIPSDGLHLKELRLTNCEYMKNLTWIRTLSEYVDQRCLEQVVVEGELGTSRGDDGIVGALLSEREDTSAAEQ